MNTLKSNFYVYWEHKSFVIECYFGNAYGGNTPAKWRLPGDSLI